MQGTIAPKLLPRLEESMEGGDRIEGNKESTAVIVGANTTVPTPDIPIRISYIIIAEFWSFCNAHYAFLAIC